MLRELQLQDMPALNMSSKSPEREINFRKFLDEMRSKDVEIFNGAVFQLASLERAVKLKGVQPQQHGKPDRERLWGEGRPVAMKAWEYTSNEADKGAQELKYGTRHDYIDGLDHLYNCTPLTMEQEWCRDDKWLDWKGTEHSSLEEWSYVTSPVPSESQLLIGGATPHTGRVGRDAGHEGWAPEKFLQIANDHIKTRMLEMELPVPADEHLLTLEDVLAARMYSGPAYAVLNPFLRLLADLDRRTSGLLASYYQCTYAATLKHLVAYIQKMARVAPLQTLFRAVPGRMPAGWFNGDEKGLFCATEFAITSASPDVSVCESYMRSNGNILFEIRCKAPDNLGVHNAAGLVLVAQFPTEGEFMFPPSTMFAVPDDVPSPISDELSSDGKYFTRIIVEPQLP